jgi:hypothetical protein
MLAMLNYGRLVTYGTSVRIIGRLPIRYFIEILYVMNF